MTIHHLVLGTVPAWVTVLQLLAAGLVAGFCALQWVWWRGEVRPASAAWSLAWSLVMSLILLAGGLFALTTPGSVRDVLVFVHAQLVAAFLVMAIPTTRAIAGGPEDPLLALGVDRPLPRARRPVVGAARPVHRRRRRPRRRPPARPDRGRRVVRRRRRRPDPAHRVRFPPRRRRRRVARDLHRERRSSTTTPWAPCSGRCGPSRWPSASRCSRSTGSGTRRTPPPGRTGCATPWPAWPTRRGSSRTPTGCCSPPGTRRAPSCATRASRVRCARSPATASSPSSSRRTRSSTPRRPGPSSSTSRRSCPPPPSATS